MRLKWNWIGLFLILTTVLTACGGAGGSQAATPEPVSITLSTNPEPPVVGKNEIILDLEEQNGQPLTGAVVDVSADHIDMTGMTMGGPATDQGNGRYAITADFSMTGTWKVSVFVRKDSLDVQKDFEIKIP